MDRFQHPQRKPAQHYAIDIEADPVTGEVHVSAAPVDDYRDLLAASVYAPERLGQFCFAFNIEAFAAKYERAVNAGALATVPTEHFFESVADRAPHHEHHVQCDFFAAPEGNLMVLRCGMCGARREAILLAHPAFSHALPPEEKAKLRAALDGAHALTPLGEDIVAHVDRQIRYGIMPVVGPFILEHREHTAPIETGTVATDRALTDGLRAFIGDATAAAASELEESQHVGAMIHVLSDDGQHWFIPVFDLPADVDERIPAIALRQAAIRRHVLRTGIHVAAVAVMSEAWLMPRASADWAERQEGVIIAVNTPHYGRVAKARVHRASGVPEEGPGRIEGPWSWGAITLGGMIGDGWMALPFPQTGAKL